MTVLADKMRGRWPGILAALGVESRYLTGKHGPCPMCGGKDRWRFDDKDGDGTWICTNCGAGNGFTLVVRIKKLDFKEAAKEIFRVGGDVKPCKTKAPPSAEANRQAMNATWRKARRLAAGDPVWRYLTLRRVPPSELFLECGEVRYHEELRYHDEPPRWFPGMVARVCDKDGKPVNIHRTYLTDHGSKACVDSVRRVMSGKLPPGSAIRLFAAGQTLGVAEGIETALAAAILFGVPVWAAINTSLLEQWMPPKGVTEVRIFADNDANFAGQCSAYKLAHRLALAYGAEHVSVEVPKLPGDWNDYLASEVIG